MKVTVNPRPLCGKISSIASKSHAHRLLICSALSCINTSILCSSTSEDIEATARCLSALCSNIEHNDDGFKVITNPKGPHVETALRNEDLSKAEGDNKTLVLDCGESGSTYRFLFPIACALGSGCTFSLKGRLPLRPMGPLFKVLKEHGIEISGSGSPKVTISGTLTPGEFTIPGDISSQFITGLIFALPLLDGDSEIVITGKTESRSYIDITLAAVRSFGIKIREKDNRFIIRGNQTYESPGLISAEGDWSNGAVWLCAAALSGHPISISNLKTATEQGDSVICDILRAFGCGVISDDHIVTAVPGKLTGIVADVSDCPDLVPVIAAVACAAEGETKIIHAERLRLKESDRLETVSSVLNALGADITELPDGLIINGKKPLTGGTVDSCGDHRITMMASLASIICEGDVTITNAESVNKSYPSFFEDLALLGGSSVTLD